MSIRSRVLNKLFSLLYGPLELLHEPAGNLIFGPSWAGRRDAVLQQLPSEGLALDIGCGNGKLLLSAQGQRERLIGIDPSRAMLRRARSTGCKVVRAEAQRLPLADGGTAAVVCTYPGRWILDSSVWAEFARITSVDAPVVVLLGGTVTRGRFAGIRSIVVRLAYGSNQGSSTTNPPGLGHAVIPGCVQCVEDEWGEVLIWMGIRVAVA